MERAAAGSELRLCWPPGIRTCRLQLETEDTTPDGDLGSGTRLTRVAAVTGGTAPPRAHPSGHHPEDTTHVKNRRHLAWTLADLAGPARA